MRIALFLLVLPIISFAETAYVTDNLRLGLHQAADTSDRAFQTLESGQELEILTRDRNYAQVRLPGGVTGYVKATYLVFEKPAKLIVAETQQANQALQDELADLRASFAAPAATIDALEQKVSNLQADIDESTSRISVLTDENDGFRRRFDQFKNSLPITWVVGAMSVCLIAGFLVGMWWVDLQSRKRHGGIRIY
jgi:SH3 domain protein